MWVRVIVPMVVGVKKESKLMDTSRAKRKYGRPFWSPGKKHTMGTVNENCIGYVEGPVNTCQWKGWVLADDRKIA